MEEFSTFDNKIEKDIYESIFWRLALRPGMSYGGTGPDAVKNK